MQTNEKILTAMIELERELTAARDEAGKEASAQLPNDDSYRFLLGVSIGFDRGLKILQVKMAALQRDA